MPTILGLLLDTAIIPFEPVMSMVRLLFGLVRFNRNLKSNRFDDLIGSIWIGFEALVITG